MDEKKRLLKNTGLITLGNMGAKIATFVLLPLYTTLLSTDDYGTYDYIVSLSIFLLPVVTMSMHEAMFRFIIEGKHEKSKIISNSFFIVLLDCFVISGIILLINAIHSFDFCSYLLFYLLSLVFYTYIVNMLRAIGKMKTFSIISCVQGVSQVVINIVVIAVFKLGLKGLIISMCISELVSVAAIFISEKLWRDIHIKELSWDLIKEMLVYSLPLIPNAICAQIINVSDRVIITSMMGKGVNGIYSVSYKFPHIIEILYHYFYNAWSESASRVINDGKEAAQKHFKDLHKTINKLISSVVFLMIAATPIMFRLLIKGDYIEGYKYTPILLLAIFFDCMGKFYSGVFTALKKTKTMAVSTIIAAVVNVAINLLFIGKYGLYAAAISTLIAEIIMVLIRIIALKKYIKFEYNPITLITELLMAVLLIMIFDYNNVSYICISIALALVYAIVCNRELLKSLFVSGKKYILKLKKR